MKTEGEKKEYNNSFYFQLGKCGTLGNPGPVGTGRRGGSGSSVREDVEMWEITLAPMG